MGIGNLKELMEHFLLMMPDPKEVIQLPVTKKRETLRTMFLPLGYVDVSISRGKSFAHGRALCLYKNE